MLSWRIAKKAYALDRSGTGGLKEAGRWHKIGQPVLYAGLSVEIAVLEKLVHTGEFLPRDLVLIEMRLPDEEALYERPPAAALPRDWAAIPPGDGSVEYGSRFLLSGRALGLIVPSAIVPEARNLLINPLHPRFVDVNMQILRPFEFDYRLT
jgi:RES domain-containing protein